MIGFEKIEYWWYLLATLILAGYLLYKGKHLRDLFTKKLDAATVKKVFPNLSINRWFLKIALMIMGILFTALSLLNPQKGTETMTVKANGVDVYLALDISNSMYAADIQPNRMERAKRLCQDIIDGMVGNRVGLIYFAGNAYLQMPISPDKALAKNLIEAAGPQQAGNQGTDIGEAIKIAMKTFDDNSVKNRVFVVITDGEDHDENAIEEAKKAKDEGLNIFAVAIGTESGAKLILPDGDGVYDESGQLVITKSNPKLVKAIADKDNDYYINSGTSNVANDIIAKINNMASGPVKTNAYAQRRSFFQWPLGLGILLISIGYFIPLYKSKKA
jgi:Ca-activated chloride channel family protein